MDYLPIKRGVICPTVTPLKPNGDINPDMMRPLVDFLIEGGVAGIYPLGTTGEGPLSDLAERKTIATRQRLKRWPDACRSSSTPAPSARATQSN